MASAARSWLIATIVLGALGGIMVSVAFKYAGNILKSFAVGCSIALNCLLSQVASYQSDSNHIAIA